MRTYKKSPKNHKFYEVNMKANVSWTLGGLKRFSESREHVTNTSE